MGRLFWKFFFFIWLAQLSTIFAVSAMFWVERQQEDARWRAMLASRGGAAMPERGPGMGPPPDRPPPDMAGRQPPPLPPGPPPPRRLKGIPVEPLVATLFGSLAFAALLAWYFSKPIRSLRSAFDAVAGGNLDVRLGPTMGGRRDELADLGRDFDHMAARLQTLLENQRRLLHDVSHELRSPLSRLQAAIGLAHQQPARLDQSLQRIERESRRIDRLVGELLTLARLNAGVAGPEEDIEVAELLCGIVADARFEAEARGCTVEFAGTCDGLVRGDGELLARAIENVLRNAVKFAPEASAVSVACSLDAARGEMRIAIGDAGPGVAEADLGAIFEPFFRGAETRDRDGHGLGLAIARRVVESMGGRIGASNRPSGGLLIEIALPVRAIRRGDGCHAPVTG